MSRRGRCRSSSRHAHWYPSYRRAQSDRRRAVPRDERRRRRGRGVAVVRDESRVVRARRSPRSASERANANAATNERGSDISEPPGRSGRRTRGRGRAETVERAVHEPESAERGGLGPVGRVEWKASCQARAIEDEHDELVRRRPCTARTTRTRRLPIGSRELHLAERRLARDAPRAPHAAVRRERRRGSRRPVSAPRPRRLLAAVVRLPCIALTAPARAATVDRRPASTGPMAAGARRAGSGRGGSATGALGGLDGVQFAAVSSKRRTSGGARAARPIRGRRSTRRRRGHVGEPAVDGERHASGRVAPRLQRRRRLCASSRRVTVPDRVDVECGGADRSGSSCPCSSPASPGRRPTAPTRSDHRGRRAERVRPGIRRRHRSSGRDRFGASAPPDGVVTERSGRRRPELGVVLEPAAVRRSPPGRSPSAAAARSTQRAPAGSRVNAVPPAAGRRRCLGCRTPRSGSSTSAGAQWTS